MMIDKKALKETIVDVALGMILAAPISYITLSIAHNNDLTISNTTALQITVFTLVALLRKYFVRVYYK